MPQDPTNVRHFASAAEKSWPAEAFFISALIDEGTYHPGTYSIGDQHFGSFKDVHEFCRDHQVKAGRSPDRALVAKKFPRFPYQGSIDASWAAVDMRNAWVSRQLRKGMTTATQLLQEEDITAAIGTLRQTLSTATPALTKGTGVADFTDIEAALDLPKACVDYDNGKIMAYTGGIGPGELWYVAARLGVGKTWELLKMAVSAAEAGWNVVVFSTEMPARAVKERIHRISLRDVTTGIDHLSLKDRRERMELWQSTAGMITVFDPSSGPCDATRVAAAAGDDTLVIVDYIGLMRATTGSRAIEDWRSAATISNELKEVTLEYNMPVIAAAQINREGQKSNKMGAEHLSQSDALGQDADLILTVREYSPRVRIKGLVKNRHGVQGVKWYSRFEPNVSGFEDISADRATSMQEHDAEIESSRME
jgi:replicative DNA helicase